MRTGHLFDETTASLWEQCGKERRDGRWGAWRLRGLGEIWKYAYVGCVEWGRNCGSHWNARGKRMERNVLMRKNKEFGSYYGHTEVSVRQEHRKLAHLGVLSGCFAR
jgi:hypothetical protein